MWAHTEVRLCSSELVGTACMHTHLSTMGRKTISYKNCKKSQDVVDSHAVCHIDMVPDRLNGTCAVS